jgi:hypothetical protein
MITHTNRTTSVDMLPSGDCVKGPNLLAAPRPLAPQHMMGIHLVRVLLYILIITYTTVFRSLFINIHHVASDKYRGQKDL